MKSKVAELIQVSILASTQVPIFNGNMFFRLIVYFLFSFVLSFCPNKQILLLIFHLKVLFPFSFLLVCLFECVCKQRLRK